MTKNEGPTVSARFSCFDCRYVTSERYAVQGDSGSDVYCTHGTVPPDPGKPGRYVGDSRWDTPNWCPLLGEAAARLRVELGCVVGTTPVDLRPPS